MMAVADVAVVAAVGVYDISETKFF